MIHPVIAIDGPAASGKSTVARKLAEKLNFVYVDTGAMYRTFAWLALKTKIDPSSRAEVKTLIEQTNFETRIENNAVTLWANGEDSAPHIRTLEVNQAVSKISQIPELREFLVNRQRQLRSQAPLVMEGRDIGTVVATDTPHKFFLDADPAIRAQRRKTEGIQDATSQRDAIDSSRKTSPLIRAADAENIDTSALTPEQIVEHITQQIQKTGIRAHSPV